MWFAIVVCALVWVVVIGYACLAMAGDEDEASLRRWERQRRELDGDDR